MLLSTLKQVRVSCKQGCEYSIENQVTLLVSVAEIVIMLTLAASEILSRNMSSGLMFRPVCHVSMVRSLVVCRLL